MAFSQRAGPQDIKGQCWTDEESDGENESEQFLYGIQVQQLLHASLLCGFVFGLVFH